MKILFVCHRFPFPPNRGGKIRPFQMIRHLSQSHRVTVASLAHSEEELNQGAGLKDHCAEVIAEVVPSLQRWAQAAAALAGGRPSSVAYFWSGQLAARIRDRAAADGFDLIMVHCAFVAHYVTDLECRLRVLDFGDLDSGKWFDYAVHRRFPLSLGYALEARKLRQYERWAAAKFDRCTVTTVGELTEYTKLGVAVPCGVIPNGVDLGYFQARANPPAQSKVIAFLGRMDYYPNIQGIVWFANEVFPRIRARVPDAELRIIGAAPARKVQRLAGRGITVTGFVPDVRAYLADAAVAVAPLTLARGTQNKVLEAIGAGLPVVSTPEAAKGIRAVPGEHLLVAPDSGEFASAVVRLLENPELRVKLAETARRHIQTAHSWPESMKILDGLLATHCPESTTEGAVASQVSP